MSVNPVSNQTGAARSVTSRQEPKSNTNVLPDTAAAVFEKSDESLQTQKLTYTSAAAGKIGGQSDQKYLSLISLVESLLTTQTVKTGQAKGLSFSKIIEKYEGSLKNIFENLRVDDATRLLAQQEISEDGYWGVKQTAARAVDFAKSLSGGDPSKLAELKAAIEKGYEQAEKAWGGTLPDICYLTKEATMKGLDDWAAQGA